MNEKQRLMIVAVLRAARDMVALSTLRVKLEGIETTVPLSAVPEYRALSAAIIELDEELCSTEIYAELSRPR